MVQLLHQDGSIKGTQAAIISLVFSGIGFVFIALRMYTRGFIVRNIGPEDWTICAAWICALAAAIAIAFETKYGNGHHIENIAPEDLVSILKALYASIIPYQTGLALAKISILWQYHRIFPAKKMRYMIYVMITVSVLYLFYSVFNNAFMCKPIALFWDKTLEGTCLSQSAIWFSNATINIVTDLIIWVMPLRALQKLQLPSKQKIGLILVFALGGLVCLVSIIRLPQLFELTKSTDPTFHNATVAWCSEVELNVAIICACLPTLKAFAANYFPSLVGQSSRDYGTSERKSVGTVAMVSRRGGGTVTEAEHFDKNFDGHAPGQIQVVTVVEQGHEDADSSDDTSPKLANRMMSTHTDMV